MSGFWLTLYVLVWPVMTFGTLVLIVSAFVKEWRTARKEGRSII
ncbi:putative transporter small subunit [Gordonia zhaorongruii]|nr:putative transporter small subunit [Gordonia zhaorongruii]